MSWHFSDLPSPGIGLLMVLLVGLGISIWLEIRRESRWPWLRRVSILILCVTLGLWAYRPYLLVVKKEGSRILWVTEPYSQFVIDSLASVLGADELWIVDSSAKGTPVAHPWEAPTTHIDTLWVVGEGLPSTWAPKLPTTSWSYLSSRDLGLDSASGILYLQPPIPTNEGLKWSVSGTVRTREANATLTLSGPDGQADSLILDQPGIHEFRFSRTAQVQGRFLYQLGLSPNHTATYPIPLVVTPARSLDILLLSGFPTFESRSLKNWLGEEGHQVAYRAQVSSNQFTEEYINRPPIRVDRLSTQELGAFSLVILSLDYFESLSTTFRNKLLLASREEGLPIFLLPNTPSTQPGRRLKQEWGTTFQRSEDKSIEYTGPSIGKASFSPWLWQSNSSHPLPLQPLRPFIYQQTYGAGHLIIHRIPSTFALLLQGKAKLYQAYWANLFNEVAQKEPTETLWGKTMLTWEGQRNSISVRHFGDSPTAIFGNAYDVPRPLPLVQHPYVPEHWEAYWQPDQSGWHWLGVVNEGTVDSAWHYAMPGNSYALMQRQQAILNWSQIEQQPRNSASKQVFARHEISPLWFWALTLLTLSFLWIEPKL